jgi:GTP-binding protein YchF
MALSCGIIGLPNAGKSTIFNALSRAGAEIAPYPFTTIKPNHGIAQVPDERLSRLAELLAPPKVVPASVEFVDIAGLVRGASQGEGLGNQFLGHIRETNALAHVVRLFGGDVAHPYGSPEPRRDVEIINTELALADLETLERRLGRLRKRVKAGEKAAAAELEEAEQLQEALGRGERVPPGSPGAAELLSAKPTVYVANVDEAELKSRLLLGELEAAAGDSPLVVMCGDLEAEMVDLEPAERQELLASLGFQEPGLNVLIRQTYRLLGLVTFYTVVGAEMRAWPLRSGSRAPEAAGLIHSDMERGFIRAEVVSADSLLSAGSMAAARERGAVRIEGKDYVVADGDVIHFRFSA